MLGSSKPKFVFVVVASEKGVHFRKCDKQIGFERVKQGDDLSFVTTLIPKQNYGQLQINGDYYDYGEGKMTLLMDPYGYLYLDAEWYKQAEKVQDVEYLDQKMLRMVEDRAGGFRYPDLRPQMVK